MDVTKHLEVARAAASRWALVGRSTMSVREAEIRALVDAGLLCTPAEREWLDASAAAAVALAWDDKTWARAEQAHAAFKAERAGKNTMGVGAVSSPELAGGAASGADPLHARIAELESKLAEATRPRKVEYVATRGGTEWVVWRQTEDRRLGGSDRRERICGYNPEEEDAERHAREHAARLNAEARP